MVSRIFLAAILAGVLAGLFLTGIQRLAVVPMILEAETYESAGPAHARDGHAHEGEAWAPENGAERTFYTALANVLMAVGFGLLLCAGYALRGRVNWREGLLWGLAGFAAFNLAPAIGLPPELPGAEAAATTARQAWWLATAVMTAGGLALITFLPRLPWKLAGGLLLVVPHLVGAPQPEHHGGSAPAELASAFVTASLITNGVFWLALGALTGLFFDRFGRSGEGAALPNPAR